MQPIQKRGVMVGLGQVFEQVVENIPERADRVYAGPVLDWIEANRERNFFGYLHVADPHAPYQPPRSHRGWYEEMLAAEGRPRWADAMWLQRARRALYDGEVAFNDDALRPLIDHLEDLALLDQTVIVFISDHGEHLGEHDLWDHIPPSFLQVIRVPLLIRLPGGSTGARSVEQPVQLVDLMPTLLDLADIDSSRLPLHGRSLLPLLEPDGDREPLDLAVVQEAMSYRRADDPKDVGSLVWDRWHFLDSGKAPALLFDHRSDPAEEVPLRSEEALRERARSALSELRRLDDELRGLLGDENPEAVVIDLDNIVNLEALGYLDP